MDTRLVAFLVQLLLPLSDNNRQPFSPQEFVRVRRELTDRFGGVTAYTRSPAEGFWEDDDGRTRRDDVIVVEVMVQELERMWWREYGAEVARRFTQQELVIRVIPYESLSIESG